MPEPRSIANFLKSRFLLLLTAVVCFASAFFIAGKESTDFSSAVSRFEDVLERKELHARQELAELSGKIKTWTYKDLFGEKPDYYETLFDREGLVFLIFEDDKLRFWTDNMVAVDNHLSYNNFRDKIVRLPNGWFAVEKMSFGKKELIALVLLKRQYAYQNKYLTSDFQQDFSLDPGVGIKVDASRLGSSKQDGTAGADVYGKEGNYVCSLVFPSASAGSPVAFYIEILLNILGLFFAAGFLQAEVRSLSEKIGRGWGFLLLVLTVTVLRYLSIEIQFPAPFYETTLFSPELYGDAESFWLGSLGDLLINALLVFFLIFYLYRRIPDGEIKPATPFFERNERALSWLAPFVLLSAVLFASRVINYVFIGMISNSNIPFTLNDIFSQNIYTYCALFIIGLFFVSFFLLSDKAARMVLQFNSGRKVLLTCLPPLALFILISDLLGTVDLILVFWPAFLFFTLLWIKQAGRSSASTETGYSFSVIVVLLFIISFLSAHIVFKFTEREERENRIIFAQKLSAEQDPLAEHLFTDVEGRISADTALARLLAHPYHKDKSPVKIAQGKTEEFRKKLISKYFSGYWEKYEIRVFVFDTACLPVVQPALTDRDNLTYFENVIKLEGVPTDSKNLFYLNNSTGRLSYLARIPLLQPGCVGDSVCRTADLYLELDSRTVSEEVGFPELMLDRKLGIAPDLLDYSYAKYKDGNLLTYHGKYPYSLSAEGFLPDSSHTEFPKNYFSETDEYSHLSYMPDRNSLVVISRNTNGRVAVITTFSYLFAFFSLLLLFLLLLRVFIYERKFRIDSFRSRIQYVLVSMVLFSLLFFGGGTIYYIKQQYERQTRQDVRDKMVSALVEGMQELGEETELKYTKSDFFSYVLKRMANIFLTDISLYDKDGNLAGSSQMKMFDEGLMSRKMCPESYYRLALKQNIEYVHDEKLGNLEYLSAYCAFRNDDGDVIGYLNIPYFARQSELEKEIASILGALINIYVLLFVISVVLALAISEYFTKPLKLIQEKLSKIKLGRANEPIGWESKDEIGSLVNEYNRMIEELQKSAELLAKSERETAWREMAKQVAHEIKNPLTPMKLSIQHLQRTWQDKSDDMDQKISRITATLIEQIETLSNIAGEFANFAQMPVTVNGRINVRTILENTIGLFKDSTDTEFTFDCAMEDAFVNADKEQMLRVFNNLLKNALQAIPEERQGKIGVWLTRKEDSLVIKIQDNGTGIAEDKMTKIFTPNFTTKTGGMGLGLAMVKSIVETCNGKIWFETARGKGTTFYVSLPVIY